MAVPRRDHQQLPRRPAAGDGHRPARADIETAGLHDPGRRLALAVAPERAGQRLAEVMLAVRAEAAFCLSLAFAADKDDIVPPGLDRLADILDHALAFAAPPMPERTWCRDEAVHRGAGVWRAEPIGRIAARPSAARSVRHETVSQNHYRFGQRARRLCHRRPYSRPQPWRRQGGGSGPTGRAAVP